MKFREERPAGPFSSKFHRGRDLETADSGQESIPRLGEILVQKGLATPKIITRILAVQKKTVMVCPDCGRRYNVRNHSPDRHYRCAVCGGALAAAGATSGVRVDASTAATPAVATDAVPLPSSESGEERRLGKYLLKRELGRGGMGVVYEAVDTALDRTVALKMVIIPPHADPQEAAREEQRFLQEAKLTAALRSIPTSSACTRGGCSKASATWRVLVQSGGGKKPIGRDRWPLAARTCGVS